MHPVAARRFRLLGAGLLLMLLASRSATAQGPELGFADTAARLRATLEQGLFTLSPYRMGHYGLRLIRQSGDARYGSLIWVDMAHWASALSHLAAETDTPAALHALAQQRLAVYAAREGARSRRRLAAVQDRPAYLVLGSRLLPALTRIDAYGLRHRDDAHLRRLLRELDWADAVTDPAMIEHWAAPLANTVFSLRQLGEGDHVARFVAAFRSRYPEPPPAPLPDAAFQNKLYGQTHIIIAASGYYRWPVAESEYQWVFDSFRAHADEIERRATPDQLAEVGLAFLLAGLTDEPLLQRIRHRVAASVSPAHGLIPSTKGATDLQIIEHRNVVAILLLDWRGVHDRPNVITDAALFERLPFGLQHIE